MITQGMPLVLKEADPNLLKISESAEGLQQNTGPARASAQVVPRRSPPRKTRQLSCRQNPPGCGLWLDQLSLGFSRKRMSVLAMVPCNVMTAMSTTCIDLGRS
jgi:hypothetical protein